MNDQLNRLTWKPNDFTWGDWALTNCQNGTIEDQIWNNKPENVRFMILSSRIILFFGFGVYAFEHEWKEIGILKKFGFWADSQDNSLI